MYMYVYMRLRVWRGKGRKGADVARTLRVCPSEHALAFHSSPIYFIRYL